MGGLFDEVGDMSCWAVLTDACPDGAGQALVDLVKLACESTQDSRVRFAKQLPDTALIGEAQGRTQVSEQTRVDILDVQDVLLRQ